MIKVVDISDLKPAGYGTSWGENGNKRYAISMLKMLRACKRLLELWEEEGVDDLIIPIPDDLISQLRDASVSYTDSEFDDIRYALEVITDSEGEELEMTKLLEMIGFFEFVEQ